MASRPFPEFVRSTVKLRSTKRVRGYLVHVHVDLTTHASSSETPVRSIAPKMSHRLAEVESMNKSKMGKEDYVNLDNYRSTPCYHECTGPSGERKQGSKVESESTK
jgi:hypothetical protein